MKKILPLQSAPAMYWLVIVGLCLGAIVALFNLLGSQETNKPEATPTITVHQKVVDAVAPDAEPMLTEVDKKEEPYQPYWKKLESNEALKALVEPPLAHKSWFDKNANKKVLDKKGLSAISRYYGFPDDLLYFMWFKETQGSCLAVSQKGASGCFQFMPDTAKQFGLMTDKHDLRSRPDASADTAARYLSWLLVLLYADNADPKNWEQLRHALAAYNAGHRNVNRSGEIKIPSFTETLRYVHDIEELTLGRATIVQWKDTLDKLSERTGVDKELLLRANLELKDDKSLRANTIVYLPDPNNGYSKVLITRGMTLYQIQRDTGVTVAELIKTNRLSKPDTLKVGQLIYIPVVTPKKTITTAANI